MHVFENQVIPVRIHNASKKFKPNLDTIRVLSFGTKFIPKWKKTNTSYTFKWFNEFKNKLNKKVFQFLESNSKLGDLEKKNLFYVKHKSVPLTEYAAINTFCWNIRDGINVLFEKDIMGKQNMSNKEKKALNLLIKNRNVKVCVNDTDKNLGAITTDKCDVITECQRQLFDVITYNKISLDEAKKLVDKIKFDLKNIVRKHMEKGSCSYQEAKFLLSKIESFSIPHFYIIWKILKKPMVGRPIVAGYNWILTPASIFVGTFLKDFYSKFDGILKDSLSLIKILEKSLFNINSFFVYSGF